MYTWKKKSTFSKVQNTIKAQGNFFNLFIFLKILLKLLIDVFITTCFFLFYWLNVTINLDSTSLQM